MWRGEPLLSPFYETSQQELLGPQINKREEQLRVPKAKFTWLSTSGWKVKIITVRILFSLYKALDTWKYLGVGLGWLCFSSRCAALSAARPSGFADSWGLGSWDSGWGGQGLKRERGQQYVLWNLLSLTPTGLYPQRLSPLAGRVCPPQSSSHSPQIAGSWDIDIYTCSTGNRLGLLRISWRLPSPGLCRQQLWSNLATRFMNQSIFIAENNPSSCLVCAHRTVLSAHPRVLMLNVGKVLVNTPREGVTERAVTLINMETNYKVGTCEVKRWELLCVSTLWFPVLSHFPYHLTQHNLFYKLKLNVKILT